MNREQKSQEIQAFGELYQGTQLMVIARNEGMNCEEVSALRKSLRSSGGTYRVFKNKLAIKSLGDNVNEK